MRGPAGKSELSHGDHRVQEQVAAHAGLAAEALTDLAAQPQPWHRPIFGESSRLHRQIDIPKAVEGGIARFLAWPDNLHRRSYLDLPKVKHAEAEAVSRPEIIDGRSFFADAK
jgi:hypothetical protein